MVIYKTINLINNKIYIGQDSKNNPAYLGSGISIKNAIAKYGNDNFKKEILEFCNSEKNLNEREIFWINFFKSYDRKIGYNIALGGNAPMKGRIQTAETKNKISIALKGKQKSHESVLKSVLKRTGKKRSEESKIKMRKPHNCEYIFTAIHKKNMSNSRIGKKFSEAHKKQLSLSKTGINISESHKLNISKNSPLTMKVMQFSLNGDYIQTFESIKKAAETINKNYQLISSVCRGIKKTGYGFIWKYASNKKSRKRR